MKSAVQKGDFRQLDNRLFATIVSKDWGEQFYVFHTNLSYLVLVQKHKNQY